MHYSCWNGPLCAGWWQRKGWNKQEIFGLWLWLSMWPLKYALGSSCMMLQRDVHTLSNNHEYFKRSYGSSSHSQFAFSSSSHIKPYFNFSLVILFIFSHHSVGESLFSRPSAHLLSLFSHYPLSSIFFTRSCLSIYQFLSSHSRFSFPPFLPYSSPTEEAKSIHVCVWLDGVRHNLELWVRQKPFFTIFGHFKEQSIDWVKLIYIENNV